MAVTGSSTDANGDQLLVSLKTPYENVTEVLGFTDSITGETTSLYYSYLSTNNCIRLYKIRVSIYRKYI